jgi:hypothetical protein
MTEIVENPEIEDQDTITEPVELLPDAEIPPLVPIEEMDDVDEIDEATERTTEPSENQDSPQDDEATEQDGDE